MSFGDLSDPARVSAGGDLGHGVPKE